MSDSPFTDAANFINRELSLLEFNARVTAQAEDESLPLLERLRFLCIASTNMDEFFEIRVSGLQQRKELSPAACNADGMLPAETMDAVLDRSRQIVKRQYQIWNNALIPAMTEAGVYFIRRDDWDDQLRQDLHTLFLEQIVPVLTPLTLDPSRPFPKILNKSLNFIVGLSGKDIFGRRRHRGLLQAPRSLPRMFRLPDNETGERYVSLSAVIQEFVAELFPGLKVRGCHQFRVTRNSDLFIDEEEVDDLASVIEGELAASRYGDVVRLEVGADCSEELSQFLIDYFQLEQEHLFHVDGPVNLNRLLTICDETSRADLLFPPFSPSTPPELLAYENYFDAIATKDIFLHHPFHSFTPIIELLSQAATDPNVLAIKQTLYRAGPQSPIVQQLVAAAYAGKEVTVIIELMARSDEAQNLALASRLQKAGAHVVYGVIGYKTHSKMLLIVRREAQTLTRYVHLGTGNYHPRTAKLYTDYGLLSASPELGTDVHNVFMQLTSLTPGEKLRHLVTSPFDLHKTVLKMIRKETERAMAGKPARIIAKLNALIEVETIRALYAASAAGVDVQLIVRGICSLRPGLSGISENIHVRSIVGRFLEHSRVYCFGADGKESVYCASADWMERNFFNRVEVCFPILRRAHKQRIVEELKLYLADNTQSWLLQGDGRYVATKPVGDEAPVCAQAMLIDRYTTSA